MLGRRRTYGYGTTEAYARSPANRVYTEVYEVSVDLHVHVYCTSTVMTGLRENRTQEGTHRFYRFRTPLRGRTHRFYSTP